MSYSVSVSEVSWLFYQGRSVGCRERLIRTDDGIHGLAGLLTMEAGPPAGVGGPPRQAGGPVAPLEGEATPARSARNLTAVGKPHLLNLGVTREGHFLFFG